MQLFFPAERLRLIASTINWRLSRQRFYALEATRNFLGAMDNQDELDDDDDDDDDGDVGERVETVALLE